MKAIFEDQKDQDVTIGIEPNNKITFSCRGIPELDLKEAYKLQSYLSSCIREIEDEHRKKLPLWKRLF